MSIKITDKYPTPPKDEQPTTRKGRKGDGRQEAILKLEVGQSFWVAASIKSVSSLKWWARARQPGREFTSKTEEKGCRIWRTK
jgi:hypothetical protein